jgi:tRNA A-37 threonylcarbamoyl transferase component Bud32/tetratricopeptide (TPR) repeat protein
MAEQEGNTGVGLPVGAKIGKYEVTQRLGIGGQAIIYKGHDALLDRDVAIKQISTHLAADAKFLERFRREAKILARLGEEQPAIVTIHELLEDEKGLFIVMEFVAGHSLETALAANEEPMDPTAALRIIWRLAAALHDVHAAGIIHRDIKPSNIIVQEGLHPKITDFGVAASATGQTSMVMGTTKYMAPELFGEGTVDARADMYSLGVIAYEMLVGRRKFNEIFADVVRDKQSEALRWMKWHANRQVQAPPLHEVEPNVPEELSHIVAKMMAKDPADRYANMEMLGRAIKFGFSPRAKTAKRARGPRRAAEGRPAARGPLPVGEAPGGRRETAEVELEEAGTATAPLPKSAFSTRTKLILVGVIVASIIAIGVIAGLQFHWAGQARARQAREAYDKAEAAYAAAIARPEGGTDDLEKALRAFAQVGTDFADTTAGAKASVRVHFCRAHVSLREGDWGATTEAQQRLQEQIYAVQRAGSAPQDWAQARDQELRDFRALHLGTRTFGEAMREARAALERDDFDGARRVINQRLGTPGADMRFTEPQKQAVADFRTEVGRRELTLLVSGLLASGDQLVGAARFDDAGKAYEQARARLKTDANTDRFLSDQQRQAMEATVAGKLKELDIERRYREAMAAAEQARLKGEKAAEMLALRKAQQVRPSAELAERIEKLELAIDLDAALALKREGRGAEAVAALQAYLKKDPDSAVAKAALDELLSGQRRDALLTAARAAVQQKDWAKALELFRQAYRIQATAEVEQEIVTCEYQIQLAVAYELVRAGKYDQALGAFEKCAAIDPSKVEEIKAIQAQVERQKEYERLLALGDAALQKEDWASARENYRKAKAVFPAKGAEADSRIKTTKYRENVRKGRRELSSGNKRSALGYLRIAKDNAQTPEEVKTVDELIAQAEKDTD